MNKKKIERKICDSFTNAAPNMYSRIESDVANINVDRAVKRKSNNRNLFWKLATGVLSLVLVVMAVLGVVGNVNQTAQATTVSLDVNPSVEIILNRNNRVVKVNPLNDDGKIIVADMDFNGCQLKVAVNALIGSMIRSGYLSKDANSVLVSVDSNKNVYQTIAEAVANEITLTLGQMNIDASVVSQWINADDEISAIAKNNNVSLGKAQLIYKISAQSEYTVEQLAELSVNDLSVILSELNINVDDVEQQGSASKEQYVGEETATQTALNLAEEGLTADNELLSKIHCKLDFKDGLIMYEVAFVYDGYAYGAYIAAKDGSVIAFSKELISNYVTTGETLDEQQIKAAAFANASVTEDQITDLYCRKSRYYRISVYEISFRSNDSIYEYEIAEDGTILYHGFELLKVSEVNSYLSRKEVDKWFFENNKQGFTVLDRDKLSRYRVTAQKTNDGLTYTVQFIYAEMQYTYKIDAVTKVISEPEIVSYENAVKDDIKNKLDGIFDFDGEFAFDEFDRYWNEWNWEENEEFEWEFEYGGEHYELEIDRWGNVWYYGGPDHGPHGEHGEPPFEYPFY